MKPMPPSVSDTKPKPSFAPRETHVNMQQREQEKANSQTLTQTGPKGGDAGVNSSTTSPSSSPER